MTSIRQATAADVDAIDAVHAAAVYEHGARAYDADVLDAWAGHEVEPDGAGDLPGIVVAEQEGAVVGFGELADGEVVAVYVHPDAASGGVGSAILEALERRAREQTVDSLDVLSSANAVGFYERHGYERMERTSYELEDGVEMAAVRLRKSL